jgi:hypothetical protein
MEAEIPCWPVCWEERESTLVRWKERRESGRREVMVGGENKELNIKRRHRERRILWFWQKLFFEINLFVKRRLDEKFLRFVWRVFEVVKTGKGGN